MKTVNFRGGLAAALLGTLVPLQAISAQIVAASGSAVDSLVAAVGQPSAAPVRGVVTRKMSPVLEPTAPMRLSSPRSRAAGPHSHSARSLAVLGESSVPLEPQRLGWRIGELEGEVAVLAQLAVQHRLELDRVAGKLTPPAASPAGEAMRVSSLVAALAVLVLLGLSRQLAPVRVAGGAGAPAPTAHVQPVATTPAAPSARRHRWGVRVRSCAPSRRRARLFT